MLQTGVAYATTADGKAILDEIDIVQDWGSGMANDSKVPSVIAYSLGKERNWGSNLSSQAVAMVHTKLQLDVSEPTAELDLILQALDGMHNLNFEYIKSASGTRKYTNKAPEQIIEDYLTEVFEYVLKAVESWTEGYRRVTPVDIVATIPAVCSPYHTSGKLLSNVTSRGPTVPKTPYFELSIELDSIRTISHC
jgi:hypothetical protein